MLSENTTSRPVTSSEAPHAPVAMIVVTVGDVSPAHLARVVEALNVRTSLSLEPARTLLGSVEQSAADVSWTSLTPEQRDILRFIRRHENRGLTFVTLASSVEFGASGVVAGVICRTRFLSEKTIRKHCDPLLRDGLLARASQRGSLLLTDKGRDVCDAMRKEESPRPSP
jgi:hypothetical protein